MEEQIESLEAFYKRKFEWIPEGLAKDVGHFNVFKLPTTEIKSIPYKRRDFYKITFCVGKSRLHYADEVYEIQEQAVVFSNPYIPYKWEHLENIKNGYYLIFNRVFFENFGNIDHYEVFKPNGKHVFELDPSQAAVVFKAFEEIRTELNSNYIHKYDAIRNKVFSLIHFIIKTRPSSRLETQAIHASHRITWLFQELLERQFPIDQNHAEMELRSPSDFAFHLNIHVNHLNKSIKEVLGKTTSELISSRILQEAKILLNQSKWNISEIAYSLGFKEVSHFNYFFKKHTHINPTSFRKARQ